MAEGKGGLREEVRGKRALRSQSPSTKNNRRISRDGRTARRVELLRFCLWQVGRQAAFGPLTTGFHELDALTSLENAALGTDGAGGLEAAML
jgi:hypothetical protein